MVKRNQVFEIKCSVPECDNVIGCFDNYRTYKRLDCKICTEYCPVPNSPPSHSFCDDCLDKQMDIIKAKKLAKGVQNEGFEFTGNPA